MKKYSFVVITYNCKDYLINCLESLNNQTGFSPDMYEVVVVDDGSSDGTGACIQKMNLTYDLNYIYIERTMDSCRNAARNTGWKNARGEFIIFLDADMIVKKNYLVNLQMCYERDKDISVVGMRLMLDEPVSHKEVIDGSIFCKIISTKPEMKYYEDRHYYLNKLSYNTASFTNAWYYFYSCNVSIPKKYLQLVGGFNESLPGWGFDDQELGFKLSRAGVKLILNQKLEGLHQFHGEVYGSPRSMDRILEQQRNIALIYKSHPDLEKVLPKWKLFVCTSLKRQSRINRIARKSSRHYLIQVKESSSVEDIKASVKELVNIKGNDIVVIDHLENSDLHLWVQFLGETKSPVKYFPASRMLDKKNIKKHMKYLKKKYPNNWFLLLTKIFLFVYIKPLFIRWFSAKKSIEGGMEYGK